jgi:hypothetical protein
MGKNYIMSTSPFSEKKLHKIGRIDQIIRDWFAAHPSQIEVQAKELMGLFIEKGIFLKNSKDGKPIRDLLRDLDKEKKLHLLSHVWVVRHVVNRSWYFKKMSAHTGKKNFS